MSNKKVTKRALLTSILAICLCLVMLIGSTFAWFTDTASTSVNQIKSGTLKVDIVNENGASLDGKSLNFKTADNRTTEILWEPGCTYVTEGFKIKNDGTLALKWKAEINEPAKAEGGVSLLDVIDFYVVTDASSKDVTKATPIAEFSGNLSAGETDKTPYYIMGVMQTTAGNDYQNLTLENVSITVYATQYTEENDSFGNTYDENAGYPVNVKDAAGLKEALTTGGTVSVTKDIETNNTEDTEEARVSITEPTNLNLDAMIVSPDNMGDNNKNFVALIVDANTTINASENGGINTGSNGGYALNVRKGATLTINGGTYYGGGTAVQVQEGTLIINGGHFAVEPFGDPYGYNFLLNCVDSAYKAGTAKIIVTGGTFVNFDPSNNAAEGAGTNFVADGYKVTSETQSNGDVWYTVVKA